MLKRIGVYSVMRGIWLVRTARLLIRTWKAWFNREICSCAGMSRTIWIIMVSTRLWMWNCCCWCSASIRRTRKSRRTSRCARSSADWSGNGNATRWRRDSRDKITTIYFLDFFPFDFLSPSLSSESFWLILFLVSSLQRSCLYFIFKFKILFASTKSFSDKLYWSSRN